MGTGGSENCDVNNRLMENEDRLSFPVFVVELRKKLETYSRQIERCIFLSSDSSETNTSVETQLQELANAEKNLQKNVNNRHNSGCKVKSKRSSKNVALTYVKKRSVAPGPHPEPCGVTAPKKLHSAGPRVVTAPRALHNGIMKEDNQQIHQCRKSIEKMLRKCKNEALARVSAFDCSTFDKIRGNKKLRNAIGLHTITNGNAVKCQMNVDKMNGYQYNSATELQIVISDGPALQPSPPSNPRKHRKYESRRQKRMRAHSENAHDSNDNAG